MENASKALIIAGAILLSILIIALGIYVFNMAKGVTDTKALDDLEIQQFNQQFTSYRGQVIGSGVVTLLDKMISNATANKEADERLPNILYFDDRGTKGSFPLKSDNVSGSTTKTSIQATKSNYDANYQNAAATLVGYGNKEVLQFAIFSDSGNQNITALSSLRSKIAEKHYYKVEFVNDDNTGLIECVVIAY